jgi:hypothetical protein
MLRSSSHTRSDGFIPVLGRGLLECQQRSPAAIRAARPPAVCSLVGRRISPPLNEEAPRAGNERFRERPASPYAISCCATRSLMSGGFMSEPTKCLRCHGNLEAGYIPNGVYNLVFPSSWVKGVPELRSSWRTRGGWFGDSLDQKRLMSKSRFRIVTYRCTSCGMLESYAPNT